MEVGFQRWRAGNSTIPQQFSQSHSKFLFPQQIPPANFLKLPANSHAIFPAISLANFRVKFLLPYIALFEIIILPYLKISFIPKLPVWNPDIALFEIMILPYLKISFIPKLLFWNPDIALFEIIILPDLKITFIPKLWFWNPDIALFEIIILPYLKITFIPKLWFWKHHIVCFETVILPYLNPWYCLIWKSNIALFGCIRVIKN